MEIFFGDHDQPIWGNAQLASSGNPTFWDTRFALETNGKKKTDQQIENIDDIHRIKVEATIVHG